MFKLSCPHLAYGTDYKNKSLPLISQLHYKKLKTFVSFDKKTLLVEISMYVHILKPITQQ